MTIKQSWMGHPVSQPAFKRAPHPAAQKRASRMGHPFSNLECWLELQFEGELDLAAGVGRGGDDAG